LISAAGRTTAAALAGGEIVGTEAKQRICHGRHPLKSGAAGRGVAYVVLGPARCDGAGDPWLGGAFGRGV
jgi:hypothetical protein